MNPNPNPNPNPKPNPLSPNAAATATQVPKVCILADLIINPLALSIDIWYVGVCVMFNDRVWIRTRVAVRG